MKIFKIIYIKFYIIFDNHIWINFTFLLYEFALDYLIYFKYIALDKIHKINYKLLYKFYNILEEDFY